MRWKRRRVRRGNGNLQIPIPAMTIFSKLMPWLLIYVILMGITVCHILRSGRNGWDKAWWIAGVLLIPLGGLVGYWWDRLWESRGEAVERRPRQAVDE